MGVLVYWSSPLLSVCERGPVNGKAVKFGLDDLVLFTEFGTVDPGLGRALSLHDLVTTTWVVMARAIQRIKATKIRAREGFEQGRPADTS